MAFVSKILAFAGSIREGSYNKKLVKIAALGAEKAGAQLTYLDLRDLPMPLFDEDFEAEHGLHPNARKFKDLLLSHHGFLISSPEYNSSISGVLKNAIDWASREVDGEKPLECFTNKVVVLMSASVGRLGGIRSLPEIRRILSNINCIVLPNQLALSFANDAFHSDGSLKDAKLQSAVTNLGAVLAQTVMRLGAE